LIIKYDFLINPTDAPVKGKRTFDDLALVYRSLSWTVVTFSTVSSVFSTKKVDAGGINILARNDIFWFEISIFYGFQKRYRQNAHDIMDKYHLITDEPRMVQALRAMDLLSNVGSTVFLLIISIFNANVTATKSYFSF